MIDVFVFVMMIVYLLIELTICKKKMRPSS